MVRIEQVSKTYGAGIEALKAVDLEIPRGAFGLLGPNGAGKTTLMRIIATLLLPTEGRVTVDGADVVAEPHAVRRRLGYLPENFGMYEELTAFQFLDYVASLKELGDATVRDAEIERVLAQTGLEGNTHQKVGTFSAGMRRRLGIAQALLGDPDLLIVDEPTSGLDPEERSRFLGLLSGMSADRWVILSTHILTDIERVCPRVAVLAAGRVRYSGPTAELRTLAEGRVWRVRLTPAELPELEADPDIRVISSRPEGDELAVRLLADEAAVPAAAEPAAPRLEDSYLLLLARAGEAALS